MRPVIREISLADFFAFNPFCLQAGLL